MQKLIVILGPTASGKSTLAVRLAKKFHGEVVSADSRQVYKGLDIGSGKITKKEMRGVPHHLLDVASPRKRFTVTQYCSRAIEAMASILRQGKVPILVGGSPLYIYALTDGWVIPEVKPNAKIRKQLEKLTVEQLLKKLQKLDPRRTQTIEQKNPRRLIRALEIVMTTKKPVPQFQKHPLPYSVLMLGIKKEKKELSSLIRRRLLRRFKGGMVAEVKKLRKSGLSWKRLEDFGLEYRWISKYLQKKIPFREMTEKLQKDTEHFAKRQMTWFKRDNRIHWLGTNQKSEKLAGEFLK